MRRNAIERFTAQSYHYYINKDPADAKARMDLTDDEVMAIRTLAAAGMKQWKIAEEFNISTLYAWEIIHGRKMEHVQDWKPGSDEWP